MAEEPQKWCLYEGDDGWQIVIPDYDSKAHGFPKGTNEAEVAGKYCPCEPRMDYENKMIIHNSFIDKERVEKSLEENFKSIKT